LAQGLEIFEALDIVKHEKRRILLGRIKKVLESGDFKIKDLSLLIKLYPNKIRTKAFEQLIEIALQKINDQELF